MKNIITRAFSKKTKKLYNDVVVLGGVKNYTEIWATVERNCPIECKPVHLQIQPKDCIVDFYTGVNDKNNNKLFGNDIVLFDGIVTPLKSVIIWNDDYCRFQIFIIEDEILKGTTTTINKLYDLTKNMNKSIEKIGNIHENPTMVNS